MPLMMTRSDKRRADEVRPVTITRHFTRHAEGSVLICLGDTKVLCNASVENRVPHFIRNCGRGWVTAEYSMLPRATHERAAREAARGKQSGRTLEIQRLIGRSLRAAIDTGKLGERTITIDCDVLQADGGTRTASVTGAWVALVDAVNGLLDANRLAENPVCRAIASVSVGIVGGEVVTDLDYSEDSRADTDMNIVMDDGGGLVEIQGTAEGASFNREMLDRMLEHASRACDLLFEKQRQSLGSAPGE